MKFRTGDVLLKVLFSPGEMIGSFIMNLRWLHSCVIVVGEVYDDYALKVSPTHTYALDNGRYFIPIEGYLQSHWFKKTVVALCLIKRKEGPDNINPNIVLTTVI